MFKIMLVYDSDKRYILPFEIIEKTLKLSKEAKRKLEVEVIKEISKG